MHLHKNARTGMQSFVLFAQLALFTATMFMLETDLHAKYDGMGIETLLLYQISAILVSNSRRLSQLRFTRRRFSSKVNSIANITCLILAILFEKFYEKSLSSLCFAVSITVLFLIQLLIIRPSTDLGFFGFLIGVIGSVAYGLYGLKSGTWIVVGICSLLLSFKCWLDKNWLEVEQDHSLPSTSATSSTQGSKNNQIFKSAINEAVIVASFSLTWMSYLFSTNCFYLGGCTSSLILQMLPSVVIFGLWLYLAFFRRVSKALSSEQIPYILLSQVS
ncbi:hypothetical protein SLA2020_006930 [Shorea laevis]